MAQPVAYSRQYNFTNYQAVSPALPLPAAQVDLELNSVKATLDQVLNNLALIQRADTALANNSVGKDQLKAEVVIGINPPAPWVTAHAYVANDTVTIGGIFYRCALAHTSGVFATDLAAVRWTLIIDFNTVTFDLPGTIHAATAKTVPNDADEFPQSDSAALWVGKKTTWANFKTSMLAAWGGLIAATTAKATPVGADMLDIADSGAANATKMVTLTSIFAAVFTAFGGLIAAATGKTTPVDADGVAIFDSAAANATKLLTWANLKTTMFAAIGPLIAAATAKTTPVDGDGVLITDSAAAGANKFTSFTNLKAFLKTYFDTLYQPLATVLTSLGSIGSALVSGDILYATAASSLARLAKGANGTVLTLAAGLPSWVAPASVNEAWAVIGTIDTSTGAFPKIQALGGTYKKLRLSFEGVSNVSASQIYSVSASDDGTNYNADVTVSGSIPAAELVSGFVDIYNTGVAATTKIVSGLMLSSATLSLLKGFSGSFATRNGVTTHIRVSASGGATTGDAGQIVVLGC